MVKTQRKKVILEDWIDLKFNVLGDRTPLEASKDKDLEVPLRALLLMLENAAQGQFFNDELGDQLRDKLGLADYEQLSPEEGERISSPVQQNFVEFKKVTDQQLLEIQASAMQIGNVRVLKKVVAEILDRPDFKGVTRDMCYSMMAHFSEDDDSAMDCINKACEEATKEDRPIGIYRVQEFEFRLARGMTDGLPELLTQIQQQHLDEPDVEYQLVRVLDRFGIGPDRGPLRGAPQQPGMPQPGMPAPPQPSAQPAAADTGSSEIWTPGQPEPPKPDNAEGDSSSGLYIPD